MVDNLYVSIFIVVNLDVNIVLVDSLDVGILIVNNLDVSILIVVNLDVGILIVNNLDVDILTGAIWMPFQKAENVVVELRRRRRAVRALPAAARLVIQQQQPGVRFDSSPFRPNFHFRMARKFLRYNVGLIFIQALNNFQKKIQFSRLYIVQTAMFCRNYGRNGFHRIGPRTLSSRFAAALTNRTRTWELKEVRVSAARLVEISPFGKHYPKCTYVRM
jgi:hypothetical protein